MKVLVTGGSGIIGWKLVNYLSDQGANVRYTYHKNDVSIAGVGSFELDIRSKEQVDRIIEHVRPDIVVHTAAMTNADACEIDRRMARNVNIEGTENIVTASERTADVVVFFSSSFVFDGAAEQYREGDEPSPINVYGNTKRMAEEIVNGAATNSLILRTDQPYCWTQGWQDDTMVTWVLDQLRHRQSFGVFDDWQNNPIFVHDLVRMTDALVRTRSQGIFHAVGSEFVDRFEWARLIARTFGEDEERIYRESSAEANLPAPRPNANLCNQKIVETTGIEPRSLAEGLKTMRDEGDVFGI